MIKIGIVDDIKEDAYKIRNFCYSFFDDRSMIVETDLFKDSMSFKEAYLKKNHEIIFMDIYLKETTGIEVSKWVRDISAETKIIFLTTSDEFIWEAFSIRSFDYILKPYQQEQIDHVLNDLLKLSKFKILNLELKVGRQIVKINAYNIQYMMSDGHYTNIKIDKELIRAYISYGKLKSMIIHIPKFLEVNRGILINMKHVTRQIDDTFVLSDGRIVPVKRKNQSQIINQFINFQLNLEKK